MRVIYFQAKCVVFDTCIYSLRLQAVKLGKAGIHVPARGHINTLRTNWRTVIKIQHLTPGEGKKG